jgi:hypothetical protein
MGGFHGRYLQDVVDVVPESDCFCPIGSTEISFVFDPLTFLVAMVVEVQQVAVDLAIVGEPKFGVPSDAPSVVPSQGPGRSEAPSRAPSLTPKKSKRGKRVLEELSNSEVESIEFNMERLLGKKKKSRRGKRVLEELSNS